MTSTKNFLLVGLFFVIVLLICYLIFRKYYSNYDLKDDYKKLNKNLSLIAIILSFFSIIFLKNVKIKINLDLGGYRCINYVTWISTFFYNLKEGYIFRGISVGLLVLSFAGLILSKKFNKSSLILPSTIGGIIASILSTLDVEYNEYKVSFFSILSFVLLIYIIINIWFKSKKIKAQ